MDFEKNLNRLEEIVTKMEKGELSLDESLKLFEEGVKLSRDCNQKINDAESKVKLLLSVSEDGEPITKNFAGEKE